MTVSLYVEGGGDANPLRRRCREGFREFLLKSPLKQRMPRVIACGGRQKAYDKFRDALAHAKEGEFIALLVDSEAAVTEKPWLHLRHRQGDQWERPKGADDRNVHLMVQVMESWFLADRDALSTYFGQKFNANALPAQQDIENVSKEDVLRGLAKATRFCARGRYNKGDHSFGILARICTDKVLSAAPHAARLIETLERETAG